MKKKKETYRQWLNPVGDYGNQSFVIASQGDNDLSYSDHSFTIQDCSRSTTLEFYGGKHKARSLAKLNKIRTALDKIEAWIKED